MLSVGETGREKKMNIAYRFRIHQTENRKSCSPKHLAAVVFYIIRNDKIREYEATKKCCEIHRRCIKKHIHF